MGNLGQYLGRIHTQEHATLKQSAIEQSHDNSTKATRSGFTWALPYQLAETSSLLGFFDPSAVVKPCQPAIDASVGPKSVASEEKEESDICGFPWVVPNRQQTTFEFQCQKY